MKLTRDQSDKLKAWLRSRGWILTQTSLYSEPNAQHPTDNKLYDFRDAVVLQASLETFQEKKS